MNTTKFDLLANFNLYEVKLLKGLDYLAIGKHLCGPATDLTISCCLNGYKQNEETHLQGLALATCCHHLCQWKYYTNTNFLLSLGITKEKFYAMTWFSSWAIDADHTSELSDMPYQSTSLSSIDKELNFEGSDVNDVIQRMPALDRALLGFMCKEIIDVGGLLLLRDHVHNVMPFCIWHNIHHSRYYDLVEFQILKKGREVSLTGCCLCTASEGSGQPRLLPTEYLIVLLDKDKDEDAMLLGAQFC
ncbi:hypothetical protein Cni_G13868 [Canna indica]|uniref:tRNA:m(4)X modification enzyme TRM13 n=1 Tax=Canna indica TaxID=4628 RepID=A0AAQ3QDF7_9LILI|nr:hypothetical protein Cni_G13868 [Canna indica]